MGLFGLTGFGEERDELLLGLVGGGLNGGLGRGGICGCILCRREGGEPPAVISVPGRGVPSAGPPNVQRTPVVPQPRQLIVPGERAGAVPDGRDAGDRPRSAQREPGPPRGDDRDDRGRRTYVDPGSAEAITITR